MSDPLGVPPPASGQGVHLLSVGRSEDERRSTLRAWIVSALRDHECFAYAELEGTPGPVASALAGSGMDLEQAHRVGSLLRVPLEDFYAVGGPSRLVARANELGFGSLRIVADARHGLQVLEEPAYLEFERGLADTCAVSPLSALCQFDSEAAGILFSEVSWMHEGYGPTSPFLAMSHDGVVELFGEVDISNSAQMVEALAGATGRAGEALTLDLTGLSLLTAAGCNALIEGTDDYRARGGVVLVVGARRSVRRVLELLDFDHAPGFALAGGSG